MNPVVLMATHARLLITKKNIESLLNQSVKPKIVLVVSDIYEANAFQSMFFPDVDVIIEKNMPLGAKWQKGVDRARILNADPLIICGSDDFLGVDFIEKGCQLLSKGWDFVGLNRFIVYDHTKKKGYLFDYLAKMPIGGGRIYTKKLLEKIKYRVFDTEKDIRLDDLGFDNVLKSGLNYLIVNKSTHGGLCLVAVKGDWPSLNPLEKHFRHANTKLVSEMKESEVKHLLNCDL